MMCGDGGVLELNSWFHAKSSAKKWGGTAEDYIAVHEAIDSSKQFIGDVRHRMMFHHTAGVWWMQQLFGRVITIRRENGSIEVPVRLIAEQHIIEDLGWLPGLEAYFDGVPIKGWMSGAKLRKEPLSALGLIAPVSLVPPATVEYRELTDDEAAAEDATRD